MLKNNKILKTVLACIIVVFISITIIMASGSDANFLTPNPDQYFELRAVEVKDVEGQNKQVIMELWGYNIQFKGLDVRFSYGENLKPSSIETNAETEDETEYFQFEKEFKDYLELFTTPANEGVMEATLVFDPPVDETEHIKNVEDIGKVIKTDGGVKLGRMSFQMTANEFNIRMV